MSFESRVVRADPATIATPLLAVLVPKGPQPASLSALDQASGGAIARVYGSRDFTGKKDEVAVVYGAGAADRVLLVGTGASTEPQTAALREPDCAGLSAPLPGRG
jgi:hypothetical protein